MRLIIISLGTCLAVAGCSSSGGTAAPVTYSQFMSRTVTIACASSFDCCTPEEFTARFEGIDPPVTTAAQCETTLNAFFGLLTPRGQASIDAGRLIFHGDRAAACLDLLEGLSCTELSTLANTSEGMLLAQGCANPFEATVALDGACDQDDECVSAYCEGGGSGSVGSAEGTCKTIPGSGAACPDGTCADGLYCSHTGADSVCAATKADGEACTSNSECTIGHCGSTGTSMSTCGADLACNGR